MYWVHTSRDEFEILVLEAKWKWNLIFCRLVGVLPKTELLISEQAVDRRQSSRSRAEDRSTALKLTAILCR